MDLYFEINFVSMSRKDMGQNKIRKQGDRGVVAEK